MYTSVNVALLSRPFGECFEKLTNTNLIVIKVNVWNKTLQEF